MKTLPKKNKNGFSSYRFVEIVNKLPPAQIKLLGDLLIEFGKWCNYSSELQAHHFDRMNMDLAQKYKEIKDCYNLVIQERYDLDDAVKKIIRTANYHSDIDELKCSVQFDLDKYDKLEKEKQRQQMAIMILNGASLREVADEYGVSKSQVWRIKEKYNNY